MALSFRSKALTAPSLSKSITADQIEALTGEIKNHFRDAVETIEAYCSKHSTTWDESFGALSLALGEAAEGSAAITLPSMSHGDASARSSSTRAKDELKGMFDGTFARPKLYQVLKSCSSTNQHCDSDSRLAKQLLDTFRRNGCELATTVEREELMQKRAMIEEKCSAFCAALNECTDTLSFTEGELDGVDTAQFSVENGKFKVTLKAPDTMPVLQFAKNADTRRRVSEAMAKKCQTENTDRFLDTLKLRHECAAMLRYPSHAHFMLETKMAQTPERAHEFLQELLQKIQTKQEQDLDRLNSLKVKEEGSEADPIQSWDVQYYIRIHKASLGVDEAEIRTYFPLEHVKSEILAIYQELLGLRFVRVEDAKVWHSDVECYAVHDANSSNDEDALGFFFLDLFPRDGKYSHQCVYPLRPSYVNGEGDRVRPACANIGNLSRGNPSMLRFREVETFFHEFGHVMHCVLSKSEHSLQAWAWSAVPWPGGVEQDFLEVPSMMLENFVWRPEILKRLSKRPSDGASLPDDTIQALSKSRFVMTGFTKARYLAMALYDLVVHSGPGPKYLYKDKEYDSIELYNVMMTDISGVSGIPNTFPVASWYHPMMGYDAGYYSYIWSEAFAADLFSEFEKSETVANAELGLRYRQEILSPCSMKDGNAMLQNFLGRDPSIDPFLSRITE